MKTITLKTPLKLQRQDLNAACASQVTLTFAFSTALILTSSAHLGNVPEETQLSSGGQKIIALTTVLACRLIVLF